jgi:hypothetical protein
MTRIVPATRLGHAFGQFLDWAAFIKGRLVNKDKTALAWGCWIKFL